MEQNQLGQVTAVNISLHIFEHNTHKFCTCSYATALPAILHYTIQSSNSHGTFYLMLTTMLLTLSTEWRNITFERYKLINILG